MLKAKHKRLKRIALVLIAVALICAVLEAGVFVFHAKKPWSPDYKKTDIAAVLEKTSLSQEDYDLIYAQTGLSKISVDALLKRGEKQKILEVQSDFFKEYQIDKTQFAPFTCFHTFNKIIATAPLEKGDIIITPTTHFSFFELGHAALVCDAENEEIINATGYHSKSGLEPLSELTCRPSFIIMRPKNKKAAEKAVQCAKNELCELPYSVSLGIIGKKYSDKASRTNCGHIVWYAYKKAGVELDSNGGPFVFPKDIAFCDELEIIQVFGMNPQKPF